MSGKDLSDMTGGIAMATTTRETSYAGVLASFGMALVVDTVRSFATMHRINQLVAKSDRV